jgi:hypothetical protein
MDTPVWVGHSCPTLLILLCSLLETRHQNLSVVKVGYRPNQHGEYGNENEGCPPMDNSKRDGKENDEQLDPPREPLSLCRLFDHLAPSDFTSVGIVRNSAPRQSLGAATFRLLLRWNGFHGSLLCCIQNRKTHTTL